MRRIDFTDTTGIPDPRYKGEKILLLTTEGTKDHWGEFEPLRGTTWEAGVEIITAESLSHALHGYFMPLLREIGRPTTASAKRVSAEQGECKSQDFCPSWDPKVCRPGGKGGPPDCYDPPLSPGESVETVSLFRTVAMAWKENRRTVVVVGEGFNIR